MAPRGTPTPSPIFLPLSSQLTLDEARPSPELVGAVAVDVEALGTSADEDAVTELVIVAFSSAAEPNIKRELLIVKLLRLPGHAHTPWASATGYPQQK